MKKYLIITLLLTTISLFAKEPNLPKKTKYKKKTSIVINIDQRQITNMPNTLTAIQIANEPEDEPKPKESKLKRISKTLSIATAGCTAVLVGSYEILVIFVASQIPHPC